MGVIMLSIKQQLDPLYRPESVAIIGATNDLRRWGGWVVDRPIRTGFEGRLYPVNPRESEIQGLPAFPTVGEISDDVDMAIIVVRAHLVPQIMQECVAKGVRSAIVISAGFEEAGPEGQELQERAVAIAREGGLRFAGPNCQGIYTAATNFNVMWPTTPMPGGISIVSQSGSYAAGLGSQLIARGVGVRSCLSIGNQADLSMADYLEYLAQDDETSAICLYVEGFRDEGRRFFETARAVTKQKPVLMFKPGRTATGARATRSHTASLAIEDSLIEAMCRQAGIIRAEGSEDLLTMADAVATAGPSTGTGVAIINGAGAQCVIIADACDALGLTVPEFDDEMRGRIQEIVPPHAPPARNPVDLGGPGPDPEMHLDVIEMMASRDDVHTVVTGSLAVGGPWGDGEMSPRDEELFERLASLPERSRTKIVISGFRGASSGDNPLLRRYREAGLPAFFGEECARAVYAMARAGDGLRRGGE
jgi:acyl-CoA synthetase (NDP forming)